MRKSQKSQLMRYLLDQAPNSTTTDSYQCKAIVYGGALIHHLPWPKFGTILSLCRMYVSLICKSKPSDVPVVVMFDSYETATSKVCEQKC